MSDNLLYKEFNQYFTFSEVDPKWVRFIKSSATDWVKGKGSQSYWAVILLYGKLSDVLVESISVESFATIVVALRPDYFTKLDAVKKLKASIYAFPHSVSIKKFNDLSPNNEVRGLIGEVDKLYNQSTENFAKTSTSSHSAEDILKHYLEQTIAVGPLTKIHEHPTIGRYTATFSVEIYMSQEMMQQNQPSTTFAFMYDHEKVTDSKINMYMGQYQKNVNKLFVVSDKDFCPEAKIVAHDNKIGIIRINPELQEHPVKVIISRWDESHNRNRSYRHMLCGIEKMVEPIIIDDGYHITTSLTDTLLRAGIPVKDNVQMIVPYLTDQEIESEAMKLIQHKVKHYMAILSKLTYKDEIPHFEIDPFELLRRQGFTIQKRNLEGKHQLGYIDFENNLVVLDRNVTFKPRIRYSGAHEAGHNQLHSHLEFPKLYDNNSSLSVMSECSSQASHRLEYQANRFASALLMPEPVIRRLFEIFQQKHLGPDYTGPIAFGNSKQDLINYLGIVNPLAKRLNVSKEAAKFRLKDLGLILECPF